MARQASQFKQQRFRQCGTQSSASTPHMLTVFGFSTALQANVEQYLKLGHGGFFPRNLEIHYSPPSYH
jgi:hypothetical protein